MLSNRKLSPLPVLLLLILVVIGAWAQETATQTFDERLGADDGAALAILFGANMKGSLDACECAVPGGGLARRVGYLEAFRKKFKETPVIQVDGGLYFNGEPGYRVWDLQNDQMARAFSRWPIEVINLSRDDLPYARKLLAKDGFSDRAQSLPMIKNFISANANFGPETNAPPPYVIKEVGGPRIFGGKKKIKIAFIGVAEPAKPGSGLRDATVSDMFDAVTRTVLKVRKECDVLIVVAHCELESALRLATENLDVDVVIAANTDGFYNPRRVGNTTVVSATPGNIRQGDLRIYLDKEGHATFKFVGINLDETVPSDPQAAAFTEAARKDRESSR